jgi:ribosomal protein S17
MRRTTLANLETKTVKAFRNIFAHHKNAEAKISDLVSCIQVELHTLVWAIGEILDVLIEQL